MLIRPVRFAVRLREKAVRLCGKTVTYLQVTNRRILQIRAYL